MLDDFLVSYTYVFTRMGKPRKWLRRNFLISVPAFFVLIIYAVFHAVICRTDLFDFVKEV